MKYISLDGEFGGLGLDKSLLTMTFIVAQDPVLDSDKKINMLDMLQLYLIPDDRIYRVDPEALSINKIDLVALSNKACNYKAAKHILYNFLKKNSDDGSDKLVPLGKNIHGDLSQIWDKLIGRGTWETFVSYRIGELSGMYTLLRSLGIIPDDVSGSLASICEFYGFDTSDAHDATFDAKLNLYAFGAMQQAICAEVWRGPRA